MSQPECEVAHSNFGDRNNIHQGNNIVNQLYNLSPTQSPPRAPVQNIPFPYPLNEELVRRPDLMDKLNALLPQTSDTYCSAALWGLGGSGKTQIALNYAYQRRRSVKCSVFWVHADNEATFSQDYKTIARAFGIDEHLKNEDLFIAVRDQIAALLDWVLVLDNADDLRLFGVAQAPEQTKNLFQYIPWASTGTVLWTSRDAHIVGTLVSPRRGIQVARMKSDEAEELLKIAGDLEANEEQVETAALLEELQWLPLAITQAGAYMRRTSTSAKEYSSLLAQSKRRWDILKENEFDRHRRHGVPNNVLETWSISIDRLKQESEISYNILHALAYISNQNIPHEIITATLKHSGSDQVRPEKIEAEATKAMTRLKEFSFIGMHQMEDGSRNYEMHKLVQEATRYGLSVVKPDILDRSFSVKEGERYFFSIALQVVYDLFPDPKPQTPEIWTQCEKYLAHAVQIGGWADLNEKQPEPGVLLSRVSDFLHQRGRWREKELVDKRDLELEQKIRGEKHPNTLTSMGRLASTYSNQGRYKEAEALQVQVVNLSREILGEKHPKTIYGVAQLALTYYKQGRYSETGALNVQVLNLRREVLGEKHPDTIQSIGNLATTYYEQGRYSKAEALYVQVLDLRREILGEKHPGTITSMGNLATTYHKQGRHSEAEALKVQVLDLRYEILGKEHPDTIESMAHLATTYHEQGRLDEAEAMEVQVLDLRREIIGKEHPDTVRSMANLASTYHAQGRHNEAETLNIQVLDLGRGILGKEHPDILTAMHNLAINWESQGRHHDALALMEECVQSRRSVLGPEHPHTVRSVKWVEKWKSEFGTLESNRVDEKQRVVQSPSEQEEGSVSGQKDNNVSEQGGNNVREQEEDNISEQEGNGPREQEEESSEHGRSKNSGLGMMARFFKWPR